MREDAFIFDQVHVLSFSFCFFFCIIFGPLRCKNALRTLLVVGGWLEWVGWMDWIGEPEVNRS